MRKNSDKHPKQARKLLAARAIEPLENRIAPATFLSYTVGTHALTIDMNAANDQADLHLNAAKTAVIVSSNTGPDQTFLIGSMPISSYAVQNEGVSDRLTVDFVNGDPINGDAFQWAGGNHGGEHLAFTGSGSAGENVTWLPDAATSGKGALTIAGGLVTPVNGTDTLNYNSFGIGGYASAASAKSATIQTNAFANYTLDKDIATGNARFSTNAGSVANHLFELTAIPTVSVNLGQTETTAQSSSLTVKDLTANPALTGLLVKGGPGNDTLTLDYSAGAPGATTAPVSFNGNGGLGDLFSFKGTGAETVQWNPDSATSFKGVISVGFAGHSTHVNYANLVGGLSTANAASVTLTTSEAEPYTLSGSAGIGDTLASGAGAASKQSMLVNAVPVLQANLGQSETSAQSSSLTVTGSFMSGDTALASVAFKGGPGSDVLTLDYSAADPTIGTALITFDGNGGAADLFAFKGSGVETVQWSPDSAASFKGVETFGFSGNATQVDYVNSTGGLSVTNVASLSLGTSEAEPYKLTGVAGTGDTLTSGPGAVSVQKMLFNGVPLLNFFLGSSESGAQTSSVTIDGTYQTGDPALTEIVFNGHQATDLLTLDYSAGDPSTNTFPINIVTGAFAFIGTGSDAAVWTPEQSLLDVNFGGGSTFITYGNSVSVSNVADLNAEINGPDAYTLSGNAFVDTLASASHSISFTGVPSVRIFLGQTESAGQSSSLTVKGSFMTGDPSLTALIFTGGSGSDTLTVDYSAGDPVANTALITFFGNGGQGDLFAFSGSGGEALQWNPDMSQSFRGTEVINVGGHFTQVDYVNSTGGLSVNHAAILTLSTTEAEPYTLSGVTGFLGFVAGAGDTLNTASGAVSHQAMLFNNVPTLTVNIGQAESSGQSSGLTVTQGYTGDVALVSVAFMGGLGSDTLTVDYSGGDPVLSPAPISFDGNGGAADLFAFKGAGGEAVQWNPDGVVSFKGSETIAFGGQATVVNYVNSKGGLSVANASSLTLTTSEAEPYALTGTGTGDRLASGAGAASTQSMLFSGVKAVQANLGQGESIGQSSSLTLDKTFMIGDPTLLTIGFQGGPGNDTLLLDYSGGAPAVTTAPITFDGNGGGGDLFRFNGVGSEVVQWNPDSTALFGGAETIGFGGHSTQVNYLNSTAGLAVNNAASLTLSTSEAEAYNLSGVAGMGDTLATAKQSMLFNGIPLVNVNLGQSEASSAASSLTVTQGYMGDAALTALAFKGGPGNDTLTLDYSGGNPASNTAAVSFDGGGGAADQFAFRGASNENVHINTDPATSHKGSVAIGFGAFATTVNYLNAAAPLSIASAATLTLTTAEAEPYLLDQVGSTGVASLSSGPGAVSAQAVDFAAVPSVYVNLGLSELASQHSSLTVRSLSGESALQTLVLTTGSGIDTLNLLPTVKSLNSTIPSLKLPTAGGEFFWKAGGLHSVLNASADISMALGDTSLTYATNVTATQIPAPLGTLGFSNTVDVVTLTGGLSGNTLDAHSYHGTLTMFGGLYDPVNTSFNAAVLSVVGAPNVGNWGEDTFISGLGSNILVGGAHSDWYVLSGQNGFATHNTVVDYGKAANGGNFIDYSKATYSTIWSPTTGFATGSVLSGVDAELYQAYPLAEYNPSSPMTAQTVNAGGTLHNPASTLTLFGGTQTTIHGFPYSYKDNPFNALRGTPRNDYLIGTFNNDTIIGGSEPHTGGNPNGATDSDVMFGLTGINYEFGNHLTNFKHFAGGSDFGFFKNSDPFSTAPTIAPITVPIPAPGPLPQVASSVMPSATPLSVNQVALLSGVKFAPAPPVYVAPSAPSIAPSVDDILNSDSKA